MIKFQINKKTKKPYNSYSIISKRTKIGSYDQLDNTLRLDIHKYIEMISKGENLSKRFLQIWKKSSGNISLVKNLKIKFTKNSIKITK